MDSNYAILSIEFGLIAIILLISLLVLREMMRIFAGGNHEVWMKTLGMVIAPLLITFVMILAIRGRIYITVI